MKKESESSGFRFIGFRDGALVNREHIMSIVPEQKGEVLPEGSATVTLTTGNKFVILPDEYNSLIEDFEKWGWIEKF